MHLEDEADVAPHVDEFAAAKPRQIVAEHLDLPFMDRAQSPDQGQQGGLAGPRGAGHHDQLPSRNLDPIIEEDLVACFALTVIVVQPRYPHDRLMSGDLCDLGRRGPFGDHRGAIKTPRRDRP